MRQFVADVRVKNFEQILPQSFEIIGTKHVLKIIQIIKRQFVSSLQIRFVVLESFNNFLG